MSARERPTPPPKDKNTPVVVTVGFDVPRADAAPLAAADAASSAAADDAAAAAAGGGALGAAVAAAAHDADAAAPAAAAEKRVKTYITDYDIKETLGEGSFGAVVYAVHKDSKQHCAIKILNKAHIVKEKKEKYVKMERNIFAMCNHRNVVQLYKTFSSPENLYYVLEVCPGGELLSHIRKHGSFDLPSATYYTAEVANGLEHLHSLGIVHRDLKPENILLSAEMHVKLTDFGTSKVLADDVKADWHGRERTNSFVGTAAFLSPELLDSREVCRASDLFALGCIVFQMVTGRLPFIGKTEYLTIEKVKALEYEFPDGFPEPAQAFCRELLVRDPAQRLGAGPDGYTKLRQHALFDGFDWDGLAADVPPPPIQSSGLKERIEARERLAAGESDAAGASGAADGADGGLTFESDDEHDKWRAFLLADEKIVKSGFVYKYKGLSVKKRQLLLTNKPRLLYLSLAKQVVKGEIPWSTEIYGVAKNATSFHIQTTDRKYVLQDKTGGGQSWVDAIEAVKASQRAKLGGAK